jgi:hypothetical protein
MAAVNADDFFRNMVSEPEVVLHRLRMERKDLIRRANAYAWALNEIERRRVECSERLEIKHRLGFKQLHGRKYRDKVEGQAAAYQRALAKLNAAYPGGYCRDELRAINIKIARMT